MERNQFFTNDLALLAAPTYNPLQPEYSQYLMLYEKGHPSKVLVWSDLTLCTSMASSNIEKNEKSASENVDFIGSIVDFDINKIFKIGQRTNIDAL